MLKKPAFFLDVQTCTGCKTCMVACKDKNDLPLGVRWRRVVEFAGGDWVRLPDGTFNQSVFAYYISVSCNHCREPLCVQNCPSQAISVQAGVGCAAAVINSALGRDGSSCCCVIDSPDSQEDEACGSGNSRKWNCC